LLFYGRVFYWTSGAASRLVDDACRLRGGSGDGGGGSIGIGAAYTHGRGRSADARDTYGRMASDHISAFICLFLGIRFVAIKRGELVQLHCHFYGAATNILIKYISIPLPISGHSVRC
jgi:hypothetical protein